MLHNTRSESYPFMCVPQCCAIHGDISQAQRTAAVESFKSGKVPLLIATDVAARGLDIPDVEVRAWEGREEGSRGSRGGQ